MSRATDIQSKLNYWLGIKAQIKGDTVLVIDNQETENKFAYTTDFTNTQIGANGNDYSNTKLCPRFLFGTSGCIGARLDCLSVKLVYRIGLTTSMVHFIQEMGHCG